MKVNSLFIPWPVLDLVTGQTIVVDACNSSFATLEAARLIVTAAESNEMTFEYDDKLTTLGGRFVANHFAQEIELV